MSGLRISDDLVLPLEAVTEPIGILAARRAGKSNGAVVLAEEMYRNHLHWVAIDPKGDWWGIRSGADGQKGGGLDVAIFGGAHGDIPLEPGSGSFIADLVVDERLTCLLDVSGFASEAEKIRFLYAFGDRLFRRKEHGQEPTHVFFEEADDYVPQRAFPEQARLVHVMARILKQGGSRGLGGTVISQRSAVVHKDILSQVQTLFALRTTGPQDRKAIRDWVSFSGENPDIIESLPGLADGEAWVWSPNFLRTTKRFQFRRRATFDSGDTPKIGASRRAPATLADIELGVLTVRMAETIEKAKAEDPRELRKQIVGLQRQLDARPAVAPERIVETVTEIREVVTDQQLKSLEDAVESLRTTIIEARFMLPTPRPASAELAHLLSRTLINPPSSYPAPASPPPPPRPDGSGEGKLGKPERLILAALAAYPTLTREQLAFLADYHPRTASFTNTIGALRTAGRITGGYPAAIRDEGAAALREAGVGPTWAPPLDEWLDRLMRSERHLLSLLGPIHPEEREQWRFDAWFARQGKPERSILQPLLDAWPASVDRDELAAAAGYHPRTASFTNTLGSLRSRELVTDFALHPDFARLIGRG